MSAASTTLAWSAAAVLMIGIATGSAPIVCTMVDQMLPGWTLTFMPFMSDTFLIGFFAAKERVPMS